MGEVSRIQELLANVMIDILARLPISSILSCRLVCKAWHGLIGEQYFAQKYLFYAPTHLILNNEHTRPRRLCTVDAKDCYTRIHWFTLSSQHGNSFANDVPVHLGNSCNGLVCICDSISHHPIRVWNPFLRSHVKLPEVNGTSQRKGASGLGFSPTTNEYKLIWVDPETWEAQVLTLGNHDWRRIERAPCRLTDSRQQPSGLFLHRALHWLLIDHDSDLICSFDMGREKFSYLPPPPAFSPKPQPEDERKQNLYCWSNLGVLEGCLYVCATDRTELSPDLKLWVMRDYGVRSSWFKKVSIKNTLLVEWWNPFRNVQLLNFRDNGLILQLRSRSYLFHYNVRERRSLPHLLAEFDDLMALVPSFISPLDVCRESR